MTAAVLENLGGLAAAPGGMASLRALILDLAAAGRLLGGETALRATQLGELVVSSSAGWSPSCETRPRRGSEWGVLKVSAVSWGQFQPDENKALPAHLEPRPELEVQSGDFLVSRANTADLVARSVVVTHTPARLMLSDKIVRLRLSDACDPRFVQIANSASNARGYYARVAGGTSSSMKNVSRAQILALPILLPPLAEQHRIVAKVDELMALCDRLEARQQDAEAAHARLVQALLDSLTQARDADEFQACWQRVVQVFPEALATESAVEQLLRVVQQLAVMGRITSRESDDGLGADLLAKITAARSKAAHTGRQRAKVDEIVREVPYDLPAEWCWSTAEQVCEVIVDCPHSTPKFVPSGVLCLDTNSVKQGRIVPARSRFVDEETYAERVARLTPRPGDVVFAREGSVGESVVIPADLRCCLGQRVMLFRPCLVEPAYLQLALSEPSAVARQLAMHKGIGAKHVNVADMRAAWVPLPPLAEQRRIVAKVTELLALCDQLKARIAAARAKHAQLAEALVAQAVAA